jgi:hypothetical protein
MKLAALPRFKERFSQPLRVVHGATLEEWVQQLFDGGWKAEQPRIMRLEGLCDQRYVEGLTVLFRK